MLEGGREAPLTGPPSSSWRLCNGRSLLGGAAQPEELQGVDDVDGVGAVHEHEADGLHVRIVPTDVLTDGAEVGEPQAEGAEAMDRNGAGHDVQREDDILEHEHGQHHDRTCERCTDLLEQVADLQVGPAVRQVHESQEDANARIDVVGDPLHLHLAVRLEVLRDVAAGGQGHHGLHRIDGAHIVDGLLLAVPCRHVVAVARPPPRRVVNVQGLVVAAGLLWALALVAREGHAEDLREGLLLVGG
mmetsp:Transcript_133149/g.425786  ORF Transcript_133149/g.425786 Transcript_133149/m.425786 type:complete len:245 (-) Transcript_133149:541-1275(-)